MARQCGGFPATPEQEQTIDLALEGDSCVVNARAGAGKTSVLEAIGREKRADGLSGLYIAYNKAIVKESAGKFTSNVLCKTAHSLAYAGFGRAYGNRLQTRLTNRIIAEEFNIPLRPAPYVTDIGFANLCHSFVRKFCNSSDTEMSMDHAPFGELTIPIADDDEARQAERAILQEALPMAKKLWSRLENTKDDIPATHDVYLKKWALSNPRLRYEFVLVDEAQDLNPVLLGVLKSQNAQIIPVGDPYQQIYSWRGAVDAMSKMDISASTELTQSFRFSQPVADLAMNVIEEQLGEKVLIRGFEPCGTKIITDEGLSKKPTPGSAVICRTNFELISNLIELMNQGKDPHLAGGVNSLISLLYGVQALQDGKKPYCLELMAFQSWDELVEFSETSNGGDLKPLVSMVQQHGAMALIRKIESLKGARTTPQSITLTTGHSCKGLEFDDVFIGSDFPHKDTHEGWNAAEANLFYVAVTRAKKRLFIGDSYPGLIAYEFNS